MAATRIVTTRSQDLQPLVTAGQSPLDLWNALSALLASRLSAEHAALLAEPVPNPARGETDWYGEGDEPPVPLASLPPDRRQAVRAKLDNEVADIRALADRLRASRIESERPFGDLLNLAMRIPGESSIYVRGDRPILVAWGHARSGPDAESVELRGRQAVPLPPMAILPAPPPSLLSVAARRAARWSFGLLAASILLLLFAAFVLVQDPFRWFDVVVPACQVAPGETAMLADLRERTAREGVLRGMLADLTQDAGHRRLMCAPLPPPPVPPQPSEDVRRAQERGAHGGKLQIVLAWNDESDLDLHVICPSGEEIKHDHRTGCGGKLDVDANADFRTAIRTPVENVSFDNPVPGTYRVLVDAFELRPVNRTPETRFRVTIRREGQDDQVINGSAKLNEHRQVVTQIQVPSP